MTITLPHHDFALLTLLTIMTAPTLTAPNDYNYFPPWLFPTDTAPYNDCITAHTITVPYYDYDCMTSTIIAPYYNYDYSPPWLFPADYAPYHDCMTAPTITSPYYDCSWLILFSTMTIWLLLQWLFPTMTMTVYYHDCSLPWLLPSMTAPYYIFDYFYHDCFQPWLLPIMTMTVLIWLLHMTNT